MCSGFDRKHVLSLVWFQLVGWCVCVVSELTEVVVETSIIEITGVLKIGDIPKFPIRHLTESMWFPLPRLL